jgi:hypothetical protein
MQSYSANVKVGRERPPLTIVARGPDRPLSAPEILVIQYIHGDDAVTNVKLLGEHTDPDTRKPMSSRKERERLALIYTDKVVKRLFGPLKAAPLPDTIDMESFVDAETGEEVEKPVSLTESLGIDEEEEAGAADEGKDADKELEAA